jgi:hypothetical protein
MKLMYMLVTVKTSEIVGNLGASIIEEPESISYKVVTVFSQVLLNTIWVVKTLAISRQESDICIRQ